MVETWESVFKKVLIPAFDHVTISKDLGCEAILWESELWRR